jgi:hypothetical protein
VNLNQISQETLDAMSGDLKKALATGFTTALGLTGYELAGPAKFLTPVLSPFRNSLARTQAPIGSLASHWKAITGINVGNANPFVGYGYAGNLVSTQEQDYTAAYAVLALGDSVQMDAAVLAKGYDDLRSRAGTNLLFNLMIAEDKMSLGGQNFALQQASTPTVTPTTTGGTIGAVTVSVAVATRTIENFWFGGGSVASAAGSSGVLSGSTNQVNATVPAVVGAVAYDWYVGTSATALYYWATTQTNVMPTLKTVLGADSTANTLPPGAVAARTGAGTNVVATFTDSSADSNAYNGLLASLAGDFGTNGSQVTHGAGTNSGAYFKSLDGAVLTESQGSVNEIDAALLSLWNTARISPTRMLMSAQQHQDVSNHIVHSGGAITMYDPNNLAQRQNGVSGGFVNTYVNKAANGTPIDMVTEPHIPNGTVVIVSDSLPYPDNQVTNVLEIETQQEYQQLEYPPARNAGAGNLGGPRYDLEVRAIEVFKNYFPGGMAVLSNIANG